MKCVIISVVVVAAMAGVMARPEEKYTSKFDNIDLKEILNNKRLLKNNHECLMNRGSCTPEATELKKVLPEALKSKCAKCTDKQREGAEYALKYLYENEQDMLKELESLYDPDGEFRKLFSEEIEKAGVKL